MINMDCPLEEKNFETIQLAHGGGGRMSQKLIERLFYPEFSNPYLNQQHDGAVIPIVEGEIAYTTDSYVVNPIFFNGGDIGDLAINGTVNDLTCCGAVPKFLTSAFIIEEGFAVSDLKRIVASMQKAAQKAEVCIVTGDTKVVDKGKCDKIFINTSGIGIIPKGIKIHPSMIKKGDAVIITGAIAEHGITILSERGNINFESDLKSDTASLNKMIQYLLKEIPQVHLMRDPTRGGISSTLNEIAEAASLKILLEEEAIPVKESVLAACDLLGLDPLYVANEGVMSIFLPKNKTERALEILHYFEEGKNASLIGYVLDSNCVPQVIVRNKFGTMRVVEMLSGEQLPRIC
ncbi:MAG: hydrogenase expression/formation protein HypE [Bacteroidales bacterium]|nr:hydrogenase expression/formation protein HypE [Bacteroidales bacterium]